MSNPESPMTNPGSIAFIGGGNMARSLIGAMIKGGTPASAITVAEPIEAVREKLAADFNVVAFADGVEAVGNADLVMLSVKPQVMRKVCESLSPVLAVRHPLIVSIAAGLRIGQIDRWLGGGFPIVRCMPNTPALIGAGATGMFANNVVTDAGRAQAASILAAAGTMVWLDDEELMDTVTGISGSGPAYFFLMIEALEDAAVAQGMSRETARSLAIQTCLGAARMASEDAEPPARLRERVTSPGGTTQAALNAFLDGGFPELVASAVAAATRRGREMSRELD